MYKYCSLLLADSTNMQKESKSEIRAQVGKKKQLSFYGSHSQYVLNGEEFEYIFPKGQMD